MHAETFAYILHQLEYGKKVAAEQRHPESRLRRDERPPFGISPDSRRARPIGPASRWRLRLGQRIRGAHGGRPGIFRWRSTRSPTASIWNSSTQGADRAVLLGRSRRRLALPRNVFRISSAARCAGVRDAGASRRVRPLARHAPSHRAGISSRGRRCPALRQSEFPQLGPDLRHCRRRWHTPSDATRRQWLGVDVHRIRSLSGIHPVPVLPKLLRAVLRWLGTTC